MDKDKPIKLPNVGRPKVLEQVRDFWVFKRVATVGSGFGVICGMIPGVGEFSVVADPQGAVFAFIQMAGGG